MKQINGYWTDENNNRWDIEIYTEEQAKKYSKSLVNCHNCDDCSYCCDCRSCNNCRYCDNCRNCRNCRNCYDCRNCEYCVDCRYCNDCSNCRYCNKCCDCRYCDNCYSCHDCRNCCDCDYCNNCCHCGNCNYCRNYKSNPQRYITSKIGRRNDQTTFYYGKTENGMEVQIICGCFRGNLEKFEKAVLETHKDNFFYRKQYLKEIEKVKVLFELEAA